MRVSHVSIAPHTLFIRPRKQSLIHLIIAQQTGTKFNFQILKLDVTNTRCGLSKLSPKKIEAPPQTLASLLDGELIIIAITF